MSLQQAFLLQNLAFLKNYSSSLMKAWIFAKKIGTIIDPQVFRPFIKVKEIGKP
jgi:hypothetical protein